jgi:chemotaxis signal transduction protein
MQHNNLARHMSSVEDYRQRLSTLQGAWDTLSLLSHLGGDSSDLIGTRQAFETLAAELLGNLSQETYKKSLLALKSKGQIAIDILVRNLYERTADIGFLSADRDLCNFVREVDAHKRNPAGTDDPAESAEHLRRRLREYVAKYSVYQDVVLLAPNGELLLTLEPQRSTERSHDPLIRESLDTRAGYVETYRRVDFQPSQDRSLIYSYRVTDGNTARAVLCLNFNLEDEARRIFSKLGGSRDWAVFAFLNAAGEVVASSDRWQLPVGAHVPLALDEGGSIIRFAGREYLAVTRKTQGYQGYRGPGWFGHAMIPLEHAFEAAEGAVRIEEQTLGYLCDSDVIFSAELRGIPAHARQIQRELNRSVWNGHVRLDARNDSESSFTKALLWEIGNAGRRTQDTFEHSIADLQATVASAILESTQLFSSLAVDILDRNLYERANDCRWWALSATLIEHLSNPPQDVEGVTRVLRHINSLYTVYHSIVLFDAQQRIVAVSNPAQAGWVGKACREPWSAETLQLRDSQAFCVSDFAPSALYDNQHTLIFGAALRSHQGRTLGGIAIVFDSRPQLLAMLQDALPRDDTGKPLEGCIGVFLDANRRVLAATAMYEPGAEVDLPRDLLLAQKTAAATVIEHRGTYYAAAACATPGYREYDRVRVTAIVLIPLGPSTSALRASNKVFTGNSKRRHAGEQVLEIATFACGEQWLGLLRDEVLEAVASTGLRTVPGKPAWHAGLLMYQGDPIPVVDLALLTGHASNARTRDVIVVEPTDRASRVGLLVDELVSIPEIAASRVLPLSDYSGHAAPRIIDRAIRPEAPDDPVLLLVNVEQLLLHVRSAVGANTRSSVDVGRG